MRVVASYDPERARAILAKGPKKRKGPKKVTVLCSAGPPTGYGAGPFCGWSGRRVDGPNVEKPCPNCGATVDVFR